MSKQHQASRRRTYGRRQHEINELHDRSARPVGILDWLEAGRADASADGAGWDRPDRTETGNPVAYGAIN